MLYSSDKRCEMTLGWLLSLLLLLGHYSRNLERLINLLSVRYDDSALLLA